MVRMINRTARMGGRFALGACVSAVLLPIACGPMGAGEANWPPRAKQWFNRALASFRVVDIDDAQLAVTRALELLPRREQVRVLAAKIALARLDYPAVLRLTEGLTSMDARAVRGRAFWYSGELERAADELDIILADPDVRDPWAEGVVKLARRGAGRKPFTVTGGLLAVSEMPRLPTAALVVPVEVNGEPTLALISTGTAEVILDSSSGREPSWVSLRFGERLEVKDVPALTKDLSGVSRELNAPIKLLLGANLLRHLNPTFDLLGGQFVARSFMPPAPPQATTVKLNYIRGGGMVIRGTLGGEHQEPNAAFLVDTGLQVPIALDADGWEKCGVSIDTLTPVPGGGSLKQGVVPGLTLGAYSIPRVPGILGVPLEEFETSLGVDLDGVLGSRVLAGFRVTLVDHGATMWLEDMPSPAAGRPASDEPLDEPSDPAGAAPAPPAPSGAG